ncbi:MAG: diguanylate cyclase [Muricomes sp.]
MKDIKKERGTLLRRRPVLLMTLFCLLFALSIALLFTHEKQRLSTEFENMIKDSLNIHTKSDAVQIDEDIENANRALKTAETIFSLMENDNPQDFLKKRNAANPVYAVEYTTLEKLQADSSSFFTQSNQKEALSNLMQGKMVVGDIFYNKDTEKYSLAVLLPLQEGDGISGVLYTRLPADNMLPQGSESAVYQDVKSCLIDADGKIIFNTFAPEQSGDLFQSLSSYKLAQPEIDRISSIINSPDIDSATFRRHGEDYFVSAAQLQHNGWTLVSFVRGPDVLLRSSAIFQDVVRTSLIAILITATVASLIFFQLLSNKKKLEEEQQRNHELAKRLQAMFDQHSALKVVLNAETKDIVDANPALCSYFGISKEELLGQNIQNFNLLPAPVLDKQFQNASSGRAMFFAAPHRLKNGEIKFLDVYASMINDGGCGLVYAILFDSTDREQYREELLQEKELLRTTLQSIGDGVVTTDNQGIITSINSVAEALTGWQSKLAIGKPFTDVFVLQNEDTGYPVENPIQKVLETGRIIGLANHTELVSRRGSPTPIADSAAPIKGENGQTYGVVMVFRDVSDEKEHNRQIKFLSYHDSLTGLYNRRYIEEMMNKMDISELLPVSVIMADVNGLKITNDVFGHQAGDALLKSVASLMQNCCHENDVIARLGGDEFVVLMPGISLEDAEAVIQCIRYSPIDIEGNTLSHSLSLGCACKDTLETDIHAAMQQAEENMYQQKLLDGKSYRNAIISTLLATLYEKSNETEAHSKRIETYCHAIGRKLQLSSREMDDLSLLALLHDIGKVGIHPNILKKPGALTDAEWDEMKRHPEIGYRIAQATPELAVIADLILSHHERWDGNGYPRNLKGEEIPLVCRILSVVDAFDAMTNDRVYRQALTVDEAIEEIERNIGKQFDPQAAQLLIEIIITESKI